MSILKVERKGGFAGMGGQGSAIQSKGEIELDNLPNIDRKQIDELFEGNVSGGMNISPDTFRYKLTLFTTNGTHTIEASEDMVPMVVKQSVKDSFI